MRVLLVGLGLLLLTACAPTGSATPPPGDGWVDDGGYVWHRDMGNSVTCYKYYNRGISCVQQ